MEKNRGGAAGVPGIYRLSRPARLYLHLSVGEEQIKIAEGCISGSGLCNPSILVQRHNNAAESSMRAPNELINVVVIMLVYQCTKYSSKVIPNAPKARQE